MPRWIRRVLADYGRLLELFVIVNLAFLAVDIYLAHSINDFARWAEWIPFYFSIAAPIVLIAAWLVAGPTPKRGVARIAGLLVGWASLLVGVAGMLLHLDSQFFHNQTLHHLVYTAPFVAPLAYAGLGLLIIMNRMVDSDSVEWARWVLFLAFGGMLGNFILSLADHAQNGFFHETEWIPVVACAFGSAFLFMTTAQPGSRALRQWCAVVMVLVALVGVLGFALHGWANLHSAMDSFRDAFIFGAPIFAPLLLPNIAILALLGLYALRELEAEPMPRVVSA